MENSTQDTNFFLMAATGFFGKPALSERPGYETPHAGRCTATGDGDSSRRINFTEYPKYFDGIFRSDNMPEPVAAVRVIVNFLLRKHFGRYGTEVFIVLICSILCSVWRGTAVLCQRQGFVK
nr:hypothetical protein [uncultured Alistipes sp.]